LQGRPIRGLSGGAWAGLDAKAIAIASASGDEDTLARALTVEKRPARAQTEALWSAARSWTSSTARIRALSHVALDLLTIHGAFREAALAGRELVAISDDAGASRGQSIGHLILAGAATALGEFEAARQAIQRAETIGPRIDHPISSLLLPAVDCRLREFIGGSRVELARRLADLGSDPESGSPSGPTMIAEASLGFLRSGDRHSARELVARLPPVLEALEPQFRIVATGTGATVVWELEDRSSAPLYLRFAREQLAEGLSDLPSVSNELTIARMASLVADAEEAGRRFDLARERLDGDGRRPLRAIVDLDEARAIWSGGNGRRQDALRLVDSAAAQFEALGMRPWEERAADLRRTIKGRSRGEHELTPREVEVLRLVLDGLTNREVASTLVLSPRTVERHLVNIYGKLGTRNRASAVTAALRLGLAPASSSAT
jgi:DNA-binding CsgD family transcriptional regulator